MTDRTTITISISGDFDLVPSDVWPDGVPDGWTIDDVVALIHAVGSPMRLVDEWALGDLDLDVTVDRPNPAWNGDTVPFGDPPPRRFRELRRVFPRWLADRLNPELAARGPVPS